jgi:hypothetical protein
MYSPKYKTGRWKGKFLDPLMILYIIRQINIKKNFGIGIMQIDRAVIEINGGCNYTCQMCPQTTPDGKTGARGKNWLRKMSLE